MMNSSISRMGGKSRLRKKIIEMMISNSPELIKIPYEYLAKAKNFEIILNNLAHKIKNNICQENQIKQKVGRK